MTDIFRVLLPYFFLATTCVQSGAVEFNVMSWGVQPDDQNPAFINQIRLGCPRDPAYCVNKLARYKDTKIRKASLAIHWKSISSSAILQQAEAYAKLIATERNLNIELSIDDFGSFVKRFGSELTKEVIEKLASDKAVAIGSHTLGITLYEDEIRTLALDRILLPMLAKVDRIVLFLHHRSSYQHIETHISLIRQLSPSSELYLGVYHYDRAEYISCTFGSSEYCSMEQDMSLFERTFVAQLLLLASNRIDGLELYPGHFDRVSSWSGWKNTRICSHNRVSSCIEQTQRMTEFVRRRLENQSKGEKR